MKAVVAGFLEEIRTKSRRCERASGGDATGARRQAHSIKGASANVGGEPCAPSRSRRRRLDRPETWQAIMAGMPELEAQFARLREAMRASAAGGTEQGAVR